MATRVRRQRLKGWRKPPGAVSVTRPGRWGNPWAVGYDGTLMQPFVYRAREPFPQNCKGFTTERAAMRYAVALFRRLMTLYRVDVSELRGKDLMCYCPESWPCHADVLLELANRED
jgi:hypothetical protein